MRNSLIVQTIATMKREVSDLIASGIIPASVQTFSELHDYCDANELGGFCDDSEGETLAGFDLWNTTFPAKVGEADSMLSDAATDAISECQNAIDAWLRNGRNEPA